MLFVAKLDPPKGKLLEDPKGGWITLRDCALITPGEFNGSS